MLEAIRYKRGSLELLEQRELPLVTRYVPIPDTAAAWAAIRDMTVRGAPAIAIAAMLSLAVELVNNGSGSQFEDSGAAQRGIEELLEYLVSSRPTAVNLAQAADEMRALMRSTLAGDPTTSPQTLVASVVTRAEAMLAEDVAANRSLGVAGAAAVLAAVPEPRRVAGVRLLTHCNTGSLATAGYGTALGVARALHERGALAHVTCTETRPYNQGARLTAYELVADGLPATLIVDGAAAARMASGAVDAVVVGADRVAANGDTANKIGTYALAVAAAHHGLPFFVAAPTTTLDPATPGGADIAIEQRDPAEITHFRGAQVAPAGIAIWNPSFDVTPASLIAGIVTERGVIWPSPGPVGSVRFDVAGFLAATSRGDQGRGVADEKEQGASRGPASETRLTARAVAPLGEEGVRAYVAARPELCRLVGPAARAGAWRVHEVGDGNINFVYLVSDPVGGGALCIKQSLPFVRMVGPGWPLSQARLRVEVEALRVQGRLCPAHVPAIHLFDPELSLVAMDCIPPPHAILRGALTRGEIFPLLGGHVAEFLSKTLYYTSYIHLGPGAFQTQVATFENREMCALTEQVIFTDPYYAAKHNRVDIPHVLDLVEGVLWSERTRRAAAEAKRWFMHQPEALLHGDFHTGSLMVTPESTYVIDAEFAFCGPIAFELGKWLANLLLAFFGAGGRAEAWGAGRVAEQQAWLLETARGSYRGFLERFADLSSGDEPKAAPEDDEGGGTLFSAPLFPTKESRRDAVRETFLDDVASQTGVMAGAVMIRRIVGIARVADLETIPDPTLRCGDMDRRSSVLCFWDLDTAVSSEWGPACK